MSVTDVCETTDKPAGQVSEPSGEVPEPATKSHDSAAGEEQEPAAKVVLNAMMGLYGSVKYVDRNFSDILFLMSPFNRLPVPATKIGTKRPPQKTGPLTRPK